MKKKKKKIFKSRQLQEKKAIGKIKFPRSHRDIISALKFQFVGSGWKTKAEPLRTPDVLCRSFPLRLSSFSLSPPPPPSLSLLPPFLFLLHSYRLNVFFIWDLNFLLFFIYRQNFYGRNILLQFCLGDRKNKFRGFKIPEAPTRKRRWKTF